jgi:type IV pilus assembly protein PilE
MTPAMKRTPARRPAGFTLTELMITLAIVAILASMAYPSYQEFVLKSRRAEAKAALMDNMQLFERHFSQVNTYNASSTVNTVWTGYKNWSGDNPNSGFYTITASIQCGRGDGQCVELQARPNRGDAMCGTLVLRSTGEKYNILTGTTAYATTANCW